MILAPQSISSGANSREVGTHNYPNSTAQTPGGVTVTPFAILTNYADPANSTAPSSGQFSWKVVYTPTDTAGHLGVQSTCVEAHSITYTNDDTGGATP